MHSCMFRTALSQNYRTAFSHAVPVKNSKLSVTPLHIFSESSALLCTRKCLEFDWCNSFNYKRYIACELLDTYLCDGVAALTSAVGYRYYDVEFNETSENIEDYINRKRCVQSGKCSPKCGCEWTNQFIVIPGMYIAGFTDKVMSSVTMEQCQNACASEDQFQCKSIDYNNGSSACYLSTVNKDDQPQEFKDSGTYIYSERICQ
ncbi:uncharacterized protein LOC121388857 [Gigantopelta aegis]|uniref:uncharacterized protein LOC121388857 n=1 Tax=Gigantopelta aegis TaxID=1735272 RepID=UPI001B88D9B6|nr:uncharacterized protein LOC121388857 [Gigantopelta aegis]